MKASSAIGLTMAASSVAVATAKTAIPPTVGSSLAAFVHSPSLSTSPKPSQNRWNLVTPISAKRKSEGSPEPTKASGGKRRKKEAEAGPSTKSFGALTPDKFPNLKDKGIKIHTLILGSHPSIESLKRSQYYGHQQNKFWWIAGDCLGFRRDTGVSESTQKPFKLASFLRYGPEDIIPYEQQTELLCSKGFALWDTVQSCRRQGSLDSNISGDVPNDIQGFCSQHPSIRRIVFSNGVGGSGLFVKHFKEWLRSGAFVPAENQDSKKIFSKWKASDGAPGSRIECVVPLAVSPAAAQKTYIEKRQSWEKYVYTPGQRDLERFDK